MHSRTNETGPRYQRIELLHSAMSEPVFSNISAYRFVDLGYEWLRQQRASIREECLGADLLGTIVLSPEGVNVALSGPRQPMYDFWSYFTSLAPFERMTYKESFSDRPTFNRMLVKIKKEIIAFGDDDIQPAVETSRRVPPHRLKEWLDEGRDVVLLDTRNDYEVELGSFRGARHLDIDSFRTFSEAARQLEADIRSQTVVTFCTGGIRCEKAAPFLEGIGFTDVYQLDGGILQYFKDCGGAYWEGECFVFDKRVAVDSSLEETETEFCFRCQHVLSPSDRQSPSYVMGVSCPYCVDSDRSTSARGS